MVSLQEDLYSGALDLWGMSASASGKNSRPVGAEYVFDNEYGTGSYWVYFCGNLFAVNDYEMHFAREGAMRYQHVEHLSIVYYEQTELFDQSGGPLASGTVGSYVAEDGAEYVAHFQGGGCVKATSLTISPDYYRDYLQERFGEIPDVRRAFAMISGRRDVPELVALFKRVRDYRGAGMAAQMFYEGAVAEAVGLVMEKAAELEKAAGRDVSRALSSDDRAALEDVHAYVSGHLDGDLSTCSLARIACMGQTKFKQVFKRMYGTSPADYVASLRMESAERLLLTTDMPIAKVASQVGYEKPGAFTEAFRRRKGVVPSALRAR